MPSDPSGKLLSIPTETILHIFSYLDLPDLASIAQVSPVLAILAADPLLHRTRIRVVAPSRVSHSLFGAGPQGIALRPTVGDLVHRNVMRGLGIERQWRMGIYFYSPHSVKQYETGLCLQRKHASIIVSSHLRRRFSATNTLQALHQSHIFPDIESSSLSVSRSLLPVMRRLKWSIQRDRLARKVRDGNGMGMAERNGDLVGFGLWFETKGRNVLGESERVRLALCPGVRKIVAFYEDLGQ